MKLRLLILLATVTTIGVIALNLSGCKKKSSTEPTETIKVKAWVVGVQDSTTYGMILHTEDGGETWVRQGQGSPVLQGIDVNNLYVLDSANVWAVCSHNTLIRTTDGGLTWTKVLTPSNSLYPDLSSISFVGTNTIWISGDNGTVYNSNNAGNSWTVFDSSFFCKGLMQGIYAITPNTVYVVGQYNLLTENTRGFIAVTQNAGSTWDTISLPNNYNQWWWIGVKATSTNNIIIYGKWGHYSMSNNNGLTWANDSVVESGMLGSGDINCLVMVTPTIFWAACDDLIEETTNDGSNWKIQSAQPSFSPYMLGIDAINNQTALTVYHAQNSNFGRIYKTIDGGNTWSLKLQIDCELNKVSYVH